MHAKTCSWSFLCCMKIQYEFLALRDLAVCMKQKYFFFMFWWKPGILILGLYLYGIKIQSNIKQTLLEKNMEKLQFSKRIFIWIDLDPAIRAEPSHEQWLSTVHMLRKQWRLGVRRSWRRKGRGEGLTCGGCCRWQSCCRRQAAVLVVCGDSSPFSSLFFSSVNLPCFFFSFYFFFRSLRPLPLFFFLRSSEPLLCIYRKNRGERGRGGHCAVAPKTARGARPLVFSTPWSATGQSLGKWGLWVGVFLSSRWERERGRLLLLLPLPCVSRGRRRPIVPFKTTPFRASFFNEQWIKRRYFGQNPPFHLKGNGGKIVSKSKSVFNL